MLMIGDQNCLKASLNKSSLYTLYMQVEQNTEWKIIDNRKE